MQGLRRSATTFWGIKKKIKSIKTTSIFSSWFVGMNFPSATTMEFDNSSPVYKTRHRLYVSILFQLVLIVLIVVISLHSKPVPTADDHRPLSRANLLNLTLIISFPIEIIALVILASGSLILGAIYLPIRYLYMSLLIGCCIEAPVLYVLCVLTEVAVQIYLHLYVIRLREQQSGSSRTDLESDSRRSSRGKIFSVSKDSTEIDPPSYNEAMSAEKPQFSSWILFLFIGWMKFCTTWRFEWE